MSGQHTPGPWGVGDLDDNGQRMVRGEHIEIATCWHHCVGSIEREMEANARLIAAAPALLEALTEMADVLGEAEDLEPGSKPTDQWVFRYRAAQVKARAAITAATQPAPLEGKS